MGRVDRIEAAARLLREAQGREDRAWPEARDPSAVVEAEAVLDAALALPADPVPSPSERDRALVREAMERALDLREAEVDADRVEAGTQHHNDPHPTPEDIAALTAAADVDAIIAAVDREHPRPEAAPVAGTLREWLVSFGVQWRDRATGAPYTLDDALDRALARVGPPPAPESSAVVAAIVARLRERADHLGTCGAEVSAYGLTAAALRSVADALLAEHPDARALLLRVAERVRDACESDDDDAPLDAADLAAIVDDVLGGGTR